jgi:hypothetical protein
MQTKDKQSGIRTPMITDSLLKTNVNPGRATTSHQVNSISGIWGFVTNVRSSFGSSNRRTGPGTGAEVVGGAITGLGNAPSMQGFFVIS